MPVKRKVRTFEQKWWVHELREAEPKLSLSAIAKQYEDEWGSSIALYLLSDWGKPA